MTERDYKRVRDVMSRDPHRIDGLALVTDAILLMRSHNVSSVVIDRRHDGDEFGMVTVNDIASRVIAADRAPERVSVYEIMTKPVIAVDADMNVKYALRLLTRHRLTRALVTADGKMVGIVTLRDMTVM